MDPHSRVREKDTNYRNVNAFEDSWASPTEIMLQMRKWGTESDKPLGPMKIFSPL